MSARMTILAALLLACPSSEVQRVEEQVGDPKGYAAKVEAECAAGQAKSCTSLGIHHAFGTYGRTKDHAAARPFFETSCAGGDAEGCKELGLLYQYGRGVAVDDAKARELFETACAQGAANGCHYVGDYHANGKGGFAKDAAQASAWYAKACAAGSKSSCGK